MCSPSAPTIRVRIPLNKMKVHKKRPGGPIFKKDILFEMITDYLPKLGITEASLYVNQASF